MKQLLTVLLSTVLLSTIAEAKSQIDQRHQSAMSQAIENSCGYFRNLEVLSVTEEVIRVDQGITDVEYVTTLVGEQRLDQAIFNTYEITVKSKYFDMYDHATQNWGLHSVDSVRCIQK